MTTKYQAGLRVSEYVLEALLGAGAFGEVWKARHHIWDGERVAVKLPTEPEYVRYLRREGMVVHGLRHPNIVRVLGLDPYAETPYLIMEWVDGPSLRDVLNEHKQGLDPGQVKTILRGILHALVVAHGANVLHRDLKPGNVLLHLAGGELDQLTEAGVKVSDFGLGLNQADTLRSIAQSASLERENTLVGTLAYMAPELRDGHAEPGPATDLYSVGVMLFELLTGERPAGAELPSGIRHDIPSIFDEIFRRLYARRDRRCQSADEVLAQLAALDATMPPPPVAMVEPPPAPAAPPLPPSGSPRPPAPAVSTPATAALQGDPPRCGHCGQGVERGDQFCTKCGRQLVDEVRRCAACGSFPGPVDQFCIFCGAQLTER